MKNSKFLVKHFYSISFSSTKLKEQACFNALIKLLPASLKNHTLFCYKKGNTLFFVLDHPGLKLEFNYNQKLINELLNILKKNNSNCKEIEIEQIKAFVTNKILKEPPASSSPLNQYKEKATGNFKIYAKS
jgi:hypothetical protein